MTKNLTAFIAEKANQHGLADSVVADIVMSWDDWLAEPKPKPKPKPEPKP